MVHLNDLEITSPVLQAKDAKDWDKITEEYERYCARVYRESACSPEPGFSITGVIMRSYVLTQKPVVLEEPEAGKTPEPSAKLGIRQFCRHKKWA